MTTAEACDRYYERLQAKTTSQEIDDRLDNHGHILVVSTDLWEECCLTADEFHQAMHEVLRDNLSYKLQRVAKA